MNLSVTAGAGNDSLVDSPTNGTASSGGDAGGTVVGNYATLNPLDKWRRSLLANGNLDASSTARSSIRARANDCLSGSWQMVRRSYSQRSTLAGLNSRYGRSCSGAALLN
jgi:hypothetical protein